MLRLRLAITFFGLLVGFWANPLSLSAQKMATFQQFLDTMLVKRQADAWSDGELIVVSNDKLATTEREQLFYQLMRAWVYDRKYYFNRTYEVARQLIPSLEFITDYYFGHLKEIESEGVDYWSAARHLAWLYAETQDADIRQFYPKAEEAFRNSGVASQRADDIANIRQSYSRYLGAQSGHAKDNLELLKADARKAPALSDAQLTRLVDFFLVYRPLQATELTLCLDELYTRWRGRYKYEECLTLLRQGIEVFRSSPDVPFSKGGYALLKLEQGEAEYYLNNYQRSVEAINEALSLFSQDASLIALQIRCNIGKAKAQNRLGQTAQARRTAALAERQCGQCSPEIKQTTLYLAFLCNLATLSLEWDDEARALRFLDPILSHPSNRGLHWQPYSEAVYLRSVIDLRHQDFAKAANRLLGVIELEDDVSKRDPAYHFLLYSLIRSGHPLATTYLKSWQTDMTELLDVILGNMDMSSRDVFWHYKSSELQSLSVLNASLHGDAESLTTAYEQTLFCRTLMQAIHRTTQDAVQRTQASVQEANAELHRQMETLSRLSGNAAAKVQHRVDSLYQVVMKSLYAEPFGYNYKPTVSFRTVQRALDQRDAAVEFVIIPGEDGSHRYGALVVRRGVASPQLVPLCPIASLPADSLCRPRLAESLYASGRLYELLWRPLEPYLTGIDNVYYAPYGPLCRINFEAIEGRGRRLGDALGMHRLVSTAYILQTLTRGHFPIREASLYADMTGNLPNARAEAEALSALLARHRVRVNKYVGGEAKAAPMRSGRYFAPELLHFAGHGYYHPHNRLTATQWGDSLLPAVKDVLMANSGLKMADGDLSALEISHIDLTHTQFALLSSCKSGLGDLDVSEGAMGLVHGFKMAGASTIVSTLWDVEEQRCVEFMTTFVEAYLNGDDISTARRRAVEATRQAYPSFADWAAFVVTE